MNKLQQRKIDLEKHYIDMDKLAADCKGTLQGKKLSLFLFKLEQIMYKHTLDACNGSITHEKAKEKAVEVLELIKKVLPEIKGLFVNFDARGYALKVQNSIENYPYLYRDMGQYGILSPKI